VVGTRDMLVWRAEMLRNETDLVKRSCGVLDSARKLRVSRGLKAGLGPNLGLRALHVYLSIDKLVRV
jgi:hypothetical protein